MKKIIISLICILGLCGCSQKINIKNSDVIVTVRKPENEIVENIQKLQDEKVILEVDGIKITKTGATIDDSGNILLEINAKNDSDKSIEFVINPTVNDIEIHGYQRLGVYAQSEIGYTCQISSSVLKEFGLGDIGKLEYTIDVYELNAETHESGDYLFTSDVITENILDNYSSDLKIEETIDLGGVYMATKLIDSSYNTNLYAVVNANSESCIKIKKVVINGDVKDGFEEYFTIKIVDKNKALLFPIPNYNYDEDTKQMKINKIETLSLIADINGEEKEITIK